MSKEEMIRKAINELDYVESNLAYDELPNIRKALDYLDQIESVEASEVMCALKEYDTLIEKLRMSSKWHLSAQEELDFITIKSYIQQQTQRDLKLKENIKIIHHICNGLELDYINKSDLMTAILEIKGLESEARK